MLHPGTPASVPLYVLLHRDRPCCNLFLRESEWNLYSEFLETLSKHEKLFEIKAFGSALGRKV